LDLFYRVSIDYPIIEVSDDFIAEMTRHGQENKELEQILKSNERLARHIE
jgi:hypothetical protein